MTKFKQLENEVLKLHNKIAMEDVKNNDDEDKLDEVCRLLLNASTLLSQLDDTNQ